ncbi:MAG TPA: CHAD domain-containing protein [Cyclobacteriaceae bacterium]|nr:CHAD domain-containing protein [Cyclobacteriaceae bacterium]
MITTLPIQNREKLHLRKIKSRYTDCLNEILNTSDDENASTEAVHELRVNLKRVDALLALLAFSKIKIPHTGLKAFKALFRTAGKLRAIQVEFDIINKYFDNDSLNPNYLHQLHEAKVKRREQYSAFLEAGPSRSLKQGVKLLKKKVDMLTKKQISRYLKDEKENLWKHLKRSIFREQELHIMRRDLKKYHLNLKITEDADLKVETLLELLGEWHDHQIAFDHVVKVIHTGRLTESESEPIKTIKYKLIGDKEVMYEKIVSFYVQSFQDKSVRLKLA